MELNTQNVQRNGPQVSWIIRYLLYGPPVSLTLQHFSVHTFNIHYFSCRVNESSLTPETLISIKGGAYQLLRVGTK